MVRLMPLCLALLGAFGEHSPPHTGATCDEEPQDEFSTLQVASKLQSIAAVEVQKRDDTKKNEDEDDEEGEDEEDEVGEDEDEKDVEAVAALQTAKLSGSAPLYKGAGRRREGWLGNVKLQPSQPSHRRRRRFRPRVVELQTESRQENPDFQDDVIFLDQIEDKFGAYMRALREFQANKELLTRQDKQATVNELHQWAVAEADEMIKLSDLVTVNEAELEGEEDDEEAARALVALQTTACPQRRRRRRRFWTRRRQGGSGDGDCRCWSDASGSDKLVDC